MEWILDNLQVVIAIIVFIVFALRSAAAQKRGEGGNPPRRPRPGSSAPEPQEAERTRQIQEEIRRRILARQRGETPSPTQELPPQPTVVVFDAEEHEREEFERAAPAYPEEGPQPHPRTTVAPPPLPNAREQEAMAAAAILEQQRRLAEQLAALRTSTRSAAYGGVPALGWQPAVTATGPSLEWRRSLRHDLHLPSSLRRAILLKEVLGEPVGTRRDWLQVPPR